MKTVLFNIIVIIISFLVSSGLYAQEYSKPAEKWAKENYEYCSKLHRSELLKLEFDKLRAVYDLFPPERKVELWKYKWKDIKKSKKLSKAEKNELRQLYDSINAEIFEPKSTKANANFQKIATEVEIVMKEEFGWDEAKLLLYCMIPMTEDEFESYCKMFNMDFPH